MTPRPTTQDGDVFDPETHALILRESDPGTDVLTVEPVIINAYGTDRDFVFITVSGIGDRGAALFLDRDQTIALRNHLQMLLDLGPFNG